jgi:hypothetical protein
VPGFNAGTAGGHAPEQRAVHCRTAGEAGYRHFFAVEPPEKLLYLQEMEQKKLEQRGLALQKVIAPMKEMMSPHSSLPRVKYYEGISGVLQGFHDFLDMTPADGTILATLSPYEPANTPEHAREHMASIQQELNGFRGGRMEKKIRLRTIVFRCATAEGMQSDDHLWLRETRIIEQPLPLYPGEIMVEGDRVFSASVQEHVVFATITDNPGIASIERSLFELGWGASTPGKEPA